MVPILGLIKDKSNGTFLWNRPFSERVSLGGFHEKIDPVCHPDPASPASDG